MVLNGVEAMHAETNSVEILEPSGKSIGAFQGEKEAVAVNIFRVIEEQLIGETKESASTALHAR